MVTLKLRFKENRKNRWMPRSNTGSWIQHIIILVPDFPEPSRAERKREKERERKRERSNNRCGVVRVLMKTTEGKKGKEWTRETETEREGGDKKTVETNEPQGSSVPSSPCFYSSVTNSIAWSSYTSEKRKKKGIKREMRLRMITDPHPGLHDKAFPLFRFSSNSLLFG